MDAPTNAPAVLVTRSVADVVRSAVNSWSVSTRALSSARERGYRQNANRPAASPERGNAEQPEGDEQQNILDRIGDRRAPAGLGRHQRIEADARQTCRGMAGLADELKRNCRAVHDEDCRKDPQPQRDRHGGWSTTAVFGRSSAGTPRHPIPGTRCRRRDPSGLFQSPSQTGSRRSSRPRAAAASPPGRAVAGPGASDPPPSWSSSGRRCRRDGRMPACSCRAVRT